MTTPPLITGAIEISVDTVSFQLYTAERILRVTISVNALAALEQTENLRPIHALRNNALVIVQTAARILEDNPTVEAIELNRGHFY